MVKHKIIKCDVRDCYDEATRWIETKELSGDFDMKGKHTFYICEEHQTTLSPEDDVIKFLNPETGRIRTVEVAVYSCDENCQVCND